MSLNKIKQIIFQCYMFCDETIERITNEILHQKSFQRLEASFVGLNNLIQVAGYYPSSIIKIKVLNISLHSLEKYILAVDAIEESWLFEKLYHQEYNHPGGEPYGLLISDYFMDINKKNHIRCLEKLADMAALTFAPLISAVKHYDEGTAVFKNFLWSELRKRVSACFMGLLYPQVLMRRPYELERIKSIDDYLWGNPCYDYAMKAISTFTETGWFSKLCVTSSDIHSINTRYDEFGIDSCKFLNRKSVVKFSFGHKKIKILNNAGLTIVSESNWKKRIIFLDDPSVQDKTTKNYTCSLSVLLSVMRFVHCLKIMFRNKIGCFMNMTCYENYLQYWLLSYCSKYLPLSARSRAQYPLASATIKLDQDKDNLTHYPFVIELTPYSRHINNKICIKSVFIVRQ